MVESHAKAIEDVLIDGLDYNLKPGASYITDRRSVTFTAQGGNSYAPNGVRVIKFLLTGDHMLDPHTVRIMFDMCNDATGDKELRTVGGPHSLFRRVRVLAGGQIVEDIDEYNRTHEMFEILQSGGVRDNNDIEGFGMHYDMKRALGRKTDRSLLTAVNYRGITAGDRRTVMFKPLLGILNQDKYIPLRYCPLTIELELVSNASDVVVFPASLLVPAATDGFAQSNCSNQWHLEQVVAKMDLCSLDNGVANTFAAHLLENGTMPISYSTFITQNQMISKADTKHTSTVTRSLSRLKSVFCTLDGTGHGEALGEFRKPWNDFYHPSDSLTVFRKSDEVQFGLQIGSKRFPENEIESLSEAFYQLRKTLGIHSSSFHALDIDFFDYRSTKFILGIDTEKVLEAGFTGLNTKQGDIMTVKLGQAQIPEANRADRLHIVLHADQLLEIRDAGVSILD